VYKQYAQMKQIKDGNRSAEPHNGINKA